MVFDVPKVDIGVIPLTTHFVVAGRQRHFLPAPSIVQPSVPSVHAIFVHSASIPSLETSLTIFK